MRSENVLPCKEEMHAIPFKAESNYPSGASDVQAAANGINAWPKMHYFLHSYTYVSWPMVRQTLG